MKPMENSYENFTWNFWRDSGSNAKKKLLSGNLEKKSEVIFKKCQAGTHVEITGKDTDRIFEKSINKSLKKSLVGFLREPFYELPEEFLE